MGCWARMGQTKQSRDRSLSSELVSDEYARLTQRAPWLKWRWLLLGVFLVGFLLTNPLLSDDFDYLMSTLISISSCAVLLKRLARPLSVTLPYWVILTVFMVGYYIKFYWLVLEPDFLRESGQMFTHAYSSADYLPAFSLATVAFASFCLAGWFFLGLSKSPSAQPDEVDRAVWQSVARFLTYVVPVLMAATFVIAYATGIFIMGLESVSLPFRLAGVIFYSRTSFIPALLLLLVFSGERGGVAAYSRLGIILLLLHGLSDVLLRSSRGQLMVMVLLLGFLFLLRDKRLKRLESVILLAGVLATFVLAPIITDYRNYRIEAPDTSINEALAGSLEGGYIEQGQFSELFTSGFRFVVLRVTGIEMLLTYSGLRVTPLSERAFDVINSSRGMAGYVTVDLLGIPSYANTSAAVSLAGWFYLVGGISLMILGVMGFVALVWFIWNGLQSLHLRILPVAQALALLWVYNFTSEGTLEAQVLPFVAMIASIFLCEWLVRRFEASRRFRMSITRQRLRVR
jgi:hypothetical protein